VPHVACFDTAFHRSHPPVADRFAIPDALYQEGVRHYGFHGLSYAYIAGAMKTQAPEIAGGKVVAAHLGSGASMCALMNGRSVDSSMGFTALDGLPMGDKVRVAGRRRDPVAATTEGLVHRACRKFLYHDCGLKGLSGLSNDIRELLASDAPLARLAVEYFTYHVARTAGALAVSMGGIDGLVFTAGIGEHSAPIRARVLERLRWVGFELDETANRAARTRITAASSRIGAYVIPTNEERVIARKTLRLIARR
jgi:acetate kinase